MKTLFLKPLAALILLFTISSPSWGDNFYLDGQIADGKNEGKSIDTSAKRPIEILSDARFSDKLPADSNSIYVANIYHNKKFYVARIPRNAVTKSHFLLEPFAGVMAHSMLRFDLDKNQPIELLAEVPTTADGDIVLLEKPIQLNSLLVSVEVSFPQGEKSFNPMVGLKTHYGVVVRAISLTGRGVSSYLSKKNKVYQLEMNFTPEEASTALMSSLALSDETGWDAMYNTLTNNCNVFSFQILKEGRPFVQQDQSFCSKATGVLRAVAEKIFPIARWYPPAAALILYWRGYRDLKSAPVKLMNNDPEFIELAKTYPKSEKKSEPEAVTQAIQTPITCDSALKP